MPQRIYSPNKAVTLLVLLVAIGMGGGAASSRVGGASSAQADAQLDFDAVQRGDAEMENRMNRVVRACAELGERNPIVSIHDQVGCVWCRVIPCVGCIAVFRNRSIIGFTYVQHWMPSTSLTVTHN